jgi:hypothetical protein
MVQPPMVEVPAITLGAQGVAADVNLRSGSCRRCLARVCRVLLGRIEYDDLLFANGNDKTDPKNRIESRSVQNGLLRTNVLE